MKHTYQPRNRPQWTPTLARKVRLAAYKRAHELVAALPTSESFYAGNTIYTVDGYRRKVLERLSKLVAGAKGKRK